MVNTALDHLPTLTDMAGEWKSEQWLAHLPSLRNQRGQALVNADFSSLSWLAAAPFSMGYHTGVLRVDGQVPTAHQFRWFAFQAQRQGEFSGLNITSSTRMVFEENAIVWRVTFKNTQASVRSACVALDCMAPFSRINDNWGWLYGQPWKNGERHDYFSAEGLRESIDDPESHAFMLTDNPRPLQFGVPGESRIDAEGIDETAMTCETQLPQHTSEAAKPKPKFAFVGELRDLKIYNTIIEPGISVATDSPIFERLNTFRLQHETHSITVDEIPLPSQLTMQWQVNPHQQQSHGYMMSHGDQPDSLQVSIKQGRLRLDMGGDCIDVEEPLPLNAWSTLTLTFDGLSAKLFVNNTLVGRTTPWWQAQRWQSKVRDQRLTITDKDSDAQACYALTTMPQRLSKKGSGGVAEWSIELNPGESKTLEYVLTFGSQTDAVADKAQQYAADFGAVYQRVEQQWQQRWRDMFTPDSGYYSGHLPMLETDDQKLKRVYYTGPLTLLYMTHTGLPTNPTIFLTGGPRLGPTITYFWDCAEWSRLFSLLEPKRLKQWIKHVLAQDINACFGIDNYTGEKIGNAYAANYYALFRQIYHYLSITGDIEFLHEEINGQTLLQHLEAMALNWQRLSSEETGGVLADFGPDHWDLLECVPNYKHVVASLNASYVWMTRKLAEIYASLGHSSKAQPLEELAHKLSHAVLALYAGNGHWLTRHPKQSEEVHHVLDFHMIAAYLHDDLSAQIKNEMVQFVETELLTDTWMRAQSLQDPVSHLSERPDHGPHGAFAAWPGNTAHGLAKLGREDLAVDLLRRLYPVTFEGAWGQAHELFVDPKSNHAPVRIAASGTSNRECNCGAAITEAFLTGLFGFDPEFSSANDQLPICRPPGAKSEFTGKLHNLRFRNNNYHVSTANGTPKVF
jgi:hypothetical protein